MIRATLIGTVASRVIPVGGSTPPSISAFDTKSNVTGGTSHPMTNVPAGALLVITTCNEADGVSSENAAAITSSPTLTWTKRADASGASSGNAEIHTAVFTAGGSITVNSNWGVNAQSSVCYVVINQESTLAGSSNTATGQSAPQVAVTTTRADSILFCVTSDWFAINGDTPTPGRTYRDNATERYYFRAVDKFTSYHYIKTATTIGTYTEGISSPVNQSGGTAILEIRGATSGGGGGDTTPPSAFTLSIGTVSSTSVSLTWTTATDNVGVVSYDIYVDGNLNANTTGTSYSVTGLAPSTQYTIYVRAKDAANNGTNSNEVTPTTSAGGSTTDFSFTIISTSGDDLKAPGRGVEHWNNAVWNNSAAVQVPPGNSLGLDEYYRFAWFDIETTTNVYDWSKFDSEIRGAIDAGRKFNFGVMPLFMNFNWMTVGGATLSYPLYLHNQMQADTANNRDWIYSGSWVPNWNSTFFLTAWENLQVAIANRLASVTYNGVLYKNAVNYIDIRGYGDFGEWHTYPWTGSEPTGREATTATLKRLIDSQKNVFSDYWLVNLIGAFDGGNASQMPAEVSWYALTETNSKGRFGWRRDNWGDPGTDTILEDNPYTYLGNSIAAKIMDTWEFAPVVGEPLNTQSTITGSCGSMHCDLERQIRLYHATSFGNGNYPSLSAAQTRTNVINSSKACGYRLVLNGGNATASVPRNSNLEINLTWQNVGISQTYEDWNVDFELRNGSTVVWNGRSTKVLKHYKPAVSGATTNDSFTIPGTTATGTFNLVLIIRDPNNFRAPLPLAITGRQADGSYILGSITIT